MKKWLAVPVVTVAVLLMPILIPAAMLAELQTRRRIRNAARTSKCPECGQTIGESALDNADTRWREYVANLRRKNPGVRLRMVRLVDAVCTSCGASLRFVKQSAAFKTTKPIPQHAKGDA